MRFAYLDGIRGIAALFVLARHWNPLLDFGFTFSHMAVDLFFMLSGFVIAHAYDEKLRSGKMSPSTFMAIRLSRLYPVYFLAILVCLVVMTSTAALDHGDPRMAQWLLSALLAMVFLPSLVSGSEFLFPLNGCFWSLFAELALNIGYAFGRRHLSDRILIAIAGGTGLLLVAAVFATGTIDHGFRSSLMSATAGLIRATFGIAVGLLLYRRRAMFARFNHPATPWIGVALIAVLMTFPDMHGANGIAELIAVFAVVPLSIALASVREPSAAWSTRLMVTLGISSYPIYLLHVPVGIVLERLASKLPVSSLHLGLGGMLALFLLSLQIERHLDIPARQWLRTRLVRQPAAARA